ncbi:MAG: exodeoxyribonuclease VII large subunit [Gammaproteobacteria bacterium]|nr:exodeoxyribonuclease VII large subunit [Gammaproteobacteria bacterium]
MVYSNETLADGNSRQSEPVITVSNLNKMARSLLEANFSSVVVEGEISNLAMPASGHWYLTLKDRSSQIRCAMFVNRNRSVQFKPSNGNQVIIRGRLSIYEGRGDYQLIADGMEEAGNGALRRAFEELKAKLQAEGLFDSDSKQQVFQNYQHIGVITSATGAAIQDILSVFRRRFPSTEITLLPVAVQGSEAAGEIINAINTANKLAAELGIQALIIGRGGGSLEDLQAFNEETVARALYASDLPIISAVGHEVDFTITDFVADLRAPTPSAAAELMSPSQSEYFDLFQGYSSKFTQFARSRIQTGQQQLHWLLKQLKHPDRNLQEHAQDLDRIEGRLQRAISNRIARQNQSLAELNRSLLASSPSQLLKQSRLRLQNGLNNLKHGVKAQVKHKQTNVIELSRSLNAVSPLNTLARGYSITYNAATKVIRKSVDVKVGSRIVSHVEKGRITSIVDGILPDKS